MTPGYDEQGPAHEGASPQRPGPLPPTYLPGSPAQPGPPPPGAGPTMVGQPAGGPTPLPAQIPAPRSYQPISGYPSGTFPVVTPPPQPEPWPAGAPPRDGGRRRGGWLLPFSLVLIVLLLIGAGVQGYLLYDMDQRLDAANRRASAGQSNDDSRLAGLEKRATELEQALGRQFNPAAVAAAALPSVFRVSAGDFSGTAFAVGRESASGGTHLFTNFHVVEQVWKRGDRQVFLERRNQRFPATITKVDQSNDLALLESKEKFPRLTTAAERVKTGEPIVVVGAPLGLEDSVTTGVVSAFRKRPDLSGEVIQFDAAINPGNSGGPVINGQKQVVGIATAKARDAEGIGLAVPITTACTALAVC